MPGLSKFPQSNALIAAALAAFTLVAFSRVLNNGFVNWDDGAYITENGHVQSGLSPESVAWAWQTSSCGNWHPLTWISLEADAQLFGVLPWGFHLTNVLVHAANALLLFHILERMTGARWPSALAAALLALHPLHVESVAWATERKDVLSAFLGLLTILAYLRYVEVRTSGRYLSMLAMYALGLTAKPMLVTLPFLLLLLDYWPLCRFGSAALPPGIAQSRGRVKKSLEDRRASLGRLTWEKAPLFFVAGASSIVTFYVQHAGGSVVDFEPLPFEKRLANALIAYVGYLRHAIWPLDLAGFYSHFKPELLSAAPLASATVLVAASCLAFALRRRFPYLLVGWCWYLGTLVPVIGLIQVGGQAMADRYTYLPLMGIYIAFAWGMSDLVMWLRVPRALAGFVAATVLAICAGLTFVQVGYWRDTPTLWRRALTVTENNEVANYNYGLYLAHQNQLSDAKRFFGEAVRIAPHWEAAQNNLGLVLNELREPEEAIPHLIAALQLNPQDADAHNNLGTSLFRVGKQEQAIAAFRAALKISPRHRRAHYNLGVALTERYEFSGAAAALMQAVEIDPAYPMVRLALANVFIHEGKFDQAEVSLLDAVRLKPDFADAYDRLGVVQCLRGDPAKATALFRQAIAFEPAMAGAYYDLAHALSKQGKAADAANCYGQGLRLDRDWPARTAHRAWNLSTAPFAERRNGALAVLLAEQACEATDFQRVEYLDVLAAAYAEAGRFEEAASTASKALSAAPETSAGAPGMRTRLDGYLHRQPFRQPSPVGVPSSSSAP
jgi:protein O-mannosyl-transferase